MNFLNAFGLIALLSIPAIIGLHFFRERRRIRRVGGLHLWRSHQQAAPSGKKLTRFLWHASLLFQILAALAATMLLAGLTANRDATVKEQVVILDDSISLRAEVDKQPVYQKLIKDLEDTLDDSGRYLLLAAGKTPRVLAGPRATAAEISDALDDWQPQASESMRDQAVTLATRILPDSGNILYVTDQAEDSTHTSILIPYSQSKPTENTGITLVERIPVSNQRDRMRFILRHFGSSSHTANITLFSGNQQILNRSMALPPQQPKSLELEVDSAPDKNVIVQIGPPDAFPLDDRAVVPPPTLKLVRVFIDNFGNYTGAFLRAISANTHVEVVNDAAQADIAFVKSGAMPRGVPWVVSISHGETSSALQVKGDEIIISRTSPAVQNLTLDDVVWTYDPASTSTLSVAPQSILLAHGNTPLLTESIATQYFHLLEMRLDFPTSNITGTSAWPILIRGIIEQCRGSLPALERTAYRLGENVPLTFLAGYESTATLVMEQVDGEEREDVYPWPWPDSLPDLDSGLYKLSLRDDDGDTSIAQFAINPLVPSESDLTNRSEGPMRWDEIGARPDVPAANNVLFIPLVIMLMLMAGAAWWAEDRSHR